MEQEENIVLISEKNLFFFIVKCSQTTLVNFNKKTNVKVKFNLCSQT